MNSPKLRHFRPNEFRRWWPYMDPRLLEALDEFRERLRAPVMISPADGALGRNLGPENTSRHNIDRWCTVQAADVMLPRAKNLRDEQQGRAVIEIATACGFGGIGVYLDWKPYPGLHLDIRPLKADGGPATWTRIDGQYVAMARAWDHAREEIA